MFLTDEETKDYRGYVVQYLKEHYDCDKWITTRLDNDDAVGRTFVEDIQKNVHNEIRNHVISYPDGYQYDVKKNILCRYNFPNNHFTSYITVDKDKTIYDFGHINLVSQNETFYINAEQPMWVEIIHGENVYNRMGTINPFDYVKKANLNKEFGVAISVRNNAIQLLFYYLYFALRKAWNKRSRMMIYFKRKLNLKYNDNRTDR